MTQPVRDPMTSARAIDIRKRARLRKGFSLSNAVMAVTLYGLS